ncbi:hypothetical protein PtA15_11A53 [Puccinia triticina]|uniref:Uncharacterized protein n=1 Tax=Puccinia triticina TaxID=208348 RepID=A0ABY7CZ21_9BASI|nr:uncharacterized protein PtA15_11A53 [Puccinia triticina]WAQ89366.1 hypothetical protein PtA15_11A53 [Puccinia triticina]WAR59415.1 hypothetical protein PtB15_11B55 [Puccinia triticina]
MLRVVNLRSLPGSGDWHFSSIAAPPAKRGRPSSSAPTPAPPPHSRAVPAKRGRPKKIPKVETSVTFKPKPLANVNGERIRAQTEAWQEH